MIGATAITFAYPAALWALLALPVDLVASALHAAAAAAHRVPALPASARADVEGGAAGPYAVVAHCSCASRLRPSSSSASRARCSAAPARTPDARTARCWSSSTTGGRRRPAGRSARVSGGSSSRKRKRASVRWRWRRRRRARACAASSPVPHAEIMEQLTGLRPQALDTDRPALLERLKVAFSDAPALDVLWLADGIDAGSAAAFAAGLATLAGGRARVEAVTDPPSAIRPALARPVIASDGIKVGVLRPSTATPPSVTVRALASNGTQPRGATSDVRSRRTSARRHARSASRAAQRARRASKSPANAVPVRSSCWTIAGGARRSASWPAPRSSSPSRCCRRSIT